MAEVRACKAEEFKEAVALINEVFRISRGHEPTMEHEFPLLLSKDNLDNMRIIREDGGIVSIVNFLKSDIYIEGTPISAASIGAVCTDSEYRGRGYSSVILDDVEKKMVRDGVEVALVSGTRSLYKRRGFEEADSFIRYRIKPKDTELDFEVAEYKDEYLDDVVRLYSQNATRYKRTYEDFGKLIKSRPFPWGKLDYKLYVLKKSEAAVGYIVIQILDETKGTVIESFGDSESVFRAVEKISSGLKLQETVHDVHVRDDANKNYGRAHEKNISNRGSIKIMNYEKLMDSLMPYFGQYIEEETLKDLKFEQRDDIYTIKLKDQSIEVAGVEAITQLVFGKVELEFHEACEIEGLAKKVFPIPFVFTENLNYQ